MTNKVSRTEKISYGLYFLGQNIFYGLVGYMTIYFTDIGIPASMIAIIALITKAWDAINDPIFGMLMDKIKFKKGKFLPWLKISVIAIPIATILLFTIPTEISVSSKIIWAIIAYMLWDTAYTLCDVPIFGIVTTMTIEQKERVSLNNTGRMFVILSGAVTGILLPLIRQKLGGWTTTIVVLSIFAVLTMIPICIFAKERVIDKEHEMENNNQDEEKYSLKDMVTCVTQNKYLLIFFASPIISSIFNVGSTWGLYMARYLYGGEEWASYIGMTMIIPTVIGAVIAMIICKRFDKFKVFYLSSVLGLILSIIRFVAGYENMQLFMILNAISGIPLGVAVILQTQFTPDCYEYGQYKTGLKMRGVTFAAQTFFAKLTGAISMTVSTYALTFIGFREGEGVVQAIGFSDKLWTYSCIGGIIGGFLTLIVLSFYKLNDHDAQLMAKCNNGIITRAEAESRMKNSY